VVQLPVADATVREPTEGDLLSVHAALERWWPAGLGASAATERALLVPRLYLQHFTVSSRLVERDDDVLGFLIGFLSPTRADEGYIHFVGVDPARRKQGLARYLYEWFFNYCRAHGRARVRAITSPGNAGSHAFHTAMGFTTEPGRLSFEGRAVQPDYDGPGMHRVSFVRSIA